MYIRTQGILRVVEDVVVHTVPRASLVYIYTCTYILWHAENL